MIIAPAAVLLALSAGAAPLQDLEATLARFTARDSDAAPGYDGVDPVNDE